MKQFQLSKEPIALVVSIHYRNWNIYLKQSNKSMSVKKLLESPYTKNHTVKKHYDTLCAFYGAKTVNSILKELFNVVPYKKSAAA